MYQMTQKLLKLVQTFWDIFQVDILNTFRQNSIETLGQESEKICIGRWRFWNISKQSKHLDHLSKLIFVLRKVSNGIILFKNK